MVGTSGKSALASSVTSARKPPDLINGAPAPRRRTRSAYDPDGRFDGQPATTKRHARDRNSMNAQTARRQAAAACPSPACVAVYAVWRGSARPVLDRLRRHRRIDRQHHRGAAPSVTAQSFSGRAHLNGETDCWMLPPVTRNGSHPVDSADGATPPAPGTFRCKILAGLLSETLRDQAHDRSIGPPGAKPTMNFTGRAGKSPPHGTPGGSPAQKTKISFFMSTSSYCRTFRRRRNLATDRKSFVGRASASFRAAQAGGAGITVPRELIASIAAALALMQENACNDGSLLMRSRRKPSSTD